MTKDTLSVPVAGLGTKKFVTVVYEIVDKQQWGETNPLKYEHNGLKAVTVSLGDLASRVDELEDICAVNNVGLPDMDYGA